MTIITEQFAPEVHLHTTEGARVALHTYWNKGPAVVTFLRHLGCAFCREFITKLRAAYPDFTARGATIVAVAQGSAPQAAHFAHVFRIPFPILADPKREAYQAFGLTECTNSTLWHPSVARESIAAATRGHFPDFGLTIEAASPNSASSLRQLGGTFIIDQSGRIHYAELAKQVYEHPRIEQLLEILDQIDSPPVGVSMES